MKIGYINGEQMQYFSNVLLPQTVEAIQNKEPMTALGIVKDSIACGAIAGYLTEGKFYIDSLYVAPGYRRQGGGRMLLDGITKLLEDEVLVNGVEIHYTVTDEEHETIAPFLQAMKFEKKEDEGQNIYLFTLAQAATSALETKEGKQAADVWSFSQIDDKILRAAQKEASVQEVLLPQLPLDSSELERELSHAIVKDGVVKAFVAFDHSCCGLLTLCCAWSGQMGPTAMIVLLRAAFKRAAQLYGLETRMAVQAVTPEAAALVQNLVPDAVAVSYSYYLPIERL